MTLRADITLECTFLLVEGYIVFRDMKMVFIVGDIH